MIRRILTILVLSVLLATVVNVVVAWGCVMSGHDAATRSSVGAPRDVDKTLWAHRRPLSFPDAPLRTVRFSEDRGLRTSRGRVFAVRQVGDPTGWAWWSGTRWVHEHHYGRIPSELRSRTYELCVIEAGWPCRSLRGLHWQGPTGDHVTRAGIEIAGGPVSWQDPAMPRVLPLLPITRGFIANEVLFALPAGLFLLGAWRLSRGTVRRRCIARGRCPDCAIELSGRALRLCPDCDRHFLDSRFRLRVPRPRRVAALLLLGAGANVIMAWVCASGVQARLLNGTGPASSLDPPREVTYGPQTLPPEERAWLRSRWQDQGTFGIERVIWARLDRFGLVQTRFVDAYGPQVLGSTAFVPLTFLVKNRAGWPMAAVSGEQWTRLADDGTPEERHVAAIPLSAFLPEYVPPEYREQFLPCRPVWSGIVLNTLCYAALFWLLATARAYGRFAFRRARVCCPECGYDLRGSSEEGCPECAWGADDTAPWWEVPVCAR